MLIDGGFHDSAADLLAPYALAEKPNKEMLIDYLKITFQHPESSPAYTDFYNNLMNAKNHLSQSEWCNLVGGNNQMSFQVMDYKPVYKEYCQYCESLQKGKLSQK
jgi:hypothetical protein